MNFSCFLHLLKSEAETTCDMKRNKKNIHQTYSKVRNLQLVVPTMKIILCIIVDVWLFQILAVISTGIRNVGHVRLSSVNRTIYLGANAPNMLQELMVSYRFVPGHQTVNLSRFPFANWMSFSNHSDHLRRQNIPLEVMHIIVFQIFQMTQLNTLDLRGLSSYNHCKSRDNQSTNQIVISQSTESDSRYSINH